MNIKSWFKKLVVGKNDKEMSAYRAELHHKINLASVAAANVSNTLQAVSLMERKIKEIRWKEADAKKRGDEKAARDFCHQGFQLRDRLNARRAAFSNELADSNTQLCEVLHALADLIE